MIFGRVFSLGVLPLSPDICAIVGSTKNCGLRAPWATQASPPPVRTTPAPTRVGITGPRWAIDHTSLSPHPLKLPSLLVSPPTQSAIKLLLTVHLTAYHL